MMANRIEKKALGLALLTVCILSACGQKRALYLPEEPISNNPTSESVQSTESAEQEKN